MSYEDICITGLNRLLEEYVMTAVQKGQFHIYNIIDIRRIASLHFLI